MSKPEVSDILIVTGGAAGGVGVAGAAGVWWALIVAGVLLVAAGVWEKV